MEILAKSLIEAKARERAYQLLDPNSEYEILGPFDRFESPHLAQQNIVPQFDDGMIIVKGKLNQVNTVVISIEGSFQGGGIGEVSGAKFAGALEKVLAECKAGNPLYPIIIYDTGGVRLQEANYGLLSIAEISAAIVALKKYVPVIGIIPGKIGSFGGMSLSAGLCSALIMTREGRLGMNGPEVVEQEAGIRELNAKDKVAIWKMLGGAARFNNHFVDALVEDDVEVFRETISDIWSGKITQKKRTEQIEHYLSLYHSVNLEQRMTFEDAADLFNGSFKYSTIENMPKGSRGRTWFEKLTKGKPSISSIPSVLVADSEIEGRPARFIAVVKNESNLYYRARNGELGLLEGWAIAKYIREAIEEDSHLEHKRMIVPIVDVPGQAFGYHEELLGIYLSCSAAIEAYATARLKGHPIISAIVGNAISGAFLAHGMQSNRLIALNDEGVNVHVMSKKSAALITQRTIEELEEASKATPSIAYDIQSFNKLGALFEIIENVQADTPSEEEVLKVQQSIIRALEDIKQDPALDLSVRLRSTIAKQSGRKASIQVREMIDQQWK